MNIKLWILIALLLSLVACRVQNPPLSGITAPSPLSTPGLSPLATPSPPSATATTAPGKAMVIGRVISEKTGQPLTHTTVRLAEVVRQGNEGAFVLDTAFSPGDITDDQGYFRFENVDAKEYVIVIGDVYNAYQIISEPSGKARVWKAEPDQVLDVGELRVALSP